MAIEEKGIDEPLLETGRASSQVKLSPAGLAPQAGRRLVVATFNIRYAVGSFLITGSLFRRAGLTRPRRRSALVEKHLAQAASAFSNDRLMPPADVIALQEADRLTRRAGGHHIAFELAARLGMDWAHAGLESPRGEQPKKKQWYLDFEEHIAEDDPGRTGIALLSRRPLAVCERVELPWAECAWRPRLAMSAALKIGPPGGDLLHIFNTHIDPHASIDDQLAQHEAILAAAERATAARDPVLLVGDFNTLTPVSRTRMRALLEARGYTTPMPSGVTTWRAGLVRLHTDWVFTRNAPVTRWGVARPLGVSDHWPVWVEIDLGRADKADIS